MQNNIQKPVVTINKGGIYEAIKSTAKSNIKPILDQEMLDYYASMTLEIKKRTLIEYQKKMEYQLGVLQGTESINEYFKAYELILDFREFILGKLGKIDYTFTWKTTYDGQAFIRTMVIGRKEMVDLITDENGKLFGLSGKKNVQGGPIVGLRFNRKWLKQINKLVKNLNAQDINITINQGESSFSIINEKTGARQIFVNSGMFKAEINNQENKRANNQIWYIFTIELETDKTKDDNKEIFSFKTKTVETKKNASSSTVFSAIGKYFADEMRTKRELIANRQLSIDPKYPNEGVLTEMYIRAKAELNQGHNHFSSRKVVSGETLFNLYQEAKGNALFSSGGDFLMEQIKSFLGTNPTLTQYSTIRKTLQSLIKDLKQSDFQKMKKSLFNELLQTPKSTENVENTLHQALSLALQTFFSDLTT